jgi:cytochrome c
MKFKILLSTTGCLVLALAGVGSVHAAVDAAQAQDLMESNKCGRCHSIEKTKAGPALKKVAAKYQGRTDGEENIIKTITTGRKVKLITDGTEEDHKIIKPQDPAKLKNLAQWILSL